MIRVSTALLISIIGPFMAWEFGEKSNLSGISGFHGLCLYAFSRLFFKFTFASLASSNTNRSNFGYRFAPTMLIFAGALGIGLDRNIISEDLGFWLATIGLPFFLSFYEGSYWSAFHAIDRSSNPGSESTRTTEFNRLETLATVLAATTVWVTNNIAGIALGAFLAMLLALGSIRWDKRIERKDLSPPRKSQDWRRGKKVTGRYGIISWSVRHAMLIFSLKAGGLPVLIVFVVASEIFGLLVSEITQSSKIVKAQIEFINWVLGKINDEEDVSNASFQNEYLKKLAEATSTKTNWLWGHRLTALGMIGMFISVISGIPESDIHESKQFGFFFASWLISQLAVRGILRKEELNLANAYLLYTKEGTKHGDGVIGLRERMKFEIQLIPYSIMLGVSIWLHSIVGMQIDDWAAIILLFWAFIYCLSSIYHLENGDNYSSRLSNKKRLENLAIEQLNKKENQEKQSN